MGLFHKIKEPIFLKEDSALSQQLQFLEGLQGSTTAEQAKKLEQEIRNVKAGLIGEQQVAFELKNSHMPLYILHDLYLEHEGLTAQIDYLVITPRVNFVIECKNLYGNIEITNTGDFIRNIGYNGKFYKERIYSPITQNERHMDLIKSIRMAERGNAFTRAMFERNFSRAYQSVVLLANPKTILNDKYAKKEIKQQVVPIDRLIAHMKQINAKIDSFDSSDKERLELAEFFLKRHQLQPDYRPRYEAQFCQPNADTSSVQAAEQVSESAAAQVVSTPEEAVHQILCPKCGAQMVLRTAARGENAGNSFYGCSRFPKCRGIVNVKE